MLDRLATAHEVLRGAKAEGLSRVELADAVKAIGRLRSRLAALEGDVATAVAELKGKATDPVEHLRSQSKQSRRAASKAIRRAEGLASMPNTRGRLADGDLTEEHVDSLIDAAHETSFDDVDSDQRLLDDTAARPADLAGKDIRGWVSRRRRAKTEEERQRRRRADRHLSMWTDDEGMMILHGAFDPVVGAEINKKIEAETERLYHTDGGRENASRVRTSQQRRADALHGLVCSGPAKVTSSASQPRNQLIVVADTDLTRAQIPGLGPIPRFELERLGCNASLFGILFDGEGQPLWHGREVRLATDIQWRALIARDGGCVLCGAEPRWCEAHHIVAWRPPARGPTDIDNLALVCGHDHHRLHSEGLILVRDRPGQWHTGPDSHTLAA